MLRLQYSAELVIINLRYTRVIICWDIREELASGYPESKNPSVSALPYSVVLYIQTQFQFMASCHNSQ